MSPVDTRTPGERLRSRRKLAGLTAAELGERAAKEAGRPRPISTSAIRNQENGTNGIPVMLAEAYAQVLGTTAQWILFGRGDEEHAAALEEMDPVDRFFAQAGTLEDMEVPLAGSISGSWMEMSFARQPTERLSIFVDVPNVDEDVALDAFEVIDGSLEPHYPKGCYIVVADVGKTVIKDGMHLLVFKPSDGINLQTIREIRSAPGGCDLVSLGQAGPPPIPYIRFRGEPDDVVQQIFIEGIVVAALILIPERRARTIDIPDILRASAEALQRAEENDRKTVD